MTDLIDTTEMYLRTILELEEEGHTPMRARIAERLGQSGPTVSQTCARMERIGLLTVSGDRHLELTTVGRKAAVSVMRKHRLAERLLTDVIGLDWQFVHEEACRWEHVISDRVELKIIEMIGDPTLSPYGNPIPGLADIGLVAGEAQGSEVVSIVDLPRAIANQETFTLSRIGEHLQIDVDLLEQMSQLQIMPGMTIRLHFEDKQVLVTNASSEDGLRFDLDLAAHIFVAAM
jgi:DtxR family Mn-dependent transcriptional regulator